MKTRIKYFIPVILILFSGSISYSQGKSKKVITEEFSVEGVCGMCKERIENAALIKGVKLASWDKETEMLKVIYRKGKVSIDDIHKAVAESGHETDKVKANEEAYNKLPDCCKYKDGTEKH